MRDDDIPSNPTRSPRFDEVCERRRALLKGVAAGGTLALAGLPLAGCSGVPTASASSKTPASPTFKPVPVSTADAVTVPEGYEAYVLYAWGAALERGDGLQRIAAYYSCDLLSEDDGTAPATVTRLSHVP